MLEQLCRILHHYPKEFKERLGIHVLYHMALALSFLHKNLIAHRDIKPANIVITSNSIFKVGGATSDGVRRHNGAVVSVRTIHRLVSTSVEWCNMFLVQELERGQPH